MTQAGAVSSDGVDIRIGRLSEMNLTWGADGPDSHLRIDVIEPSTTLHAGDVIVVTAAKRNSPQGTNKKAHPRGVRLRSGALTSTFPHRGELRCILTEF
jgi:hypothetical protein